MFVIMNRLRAPAEFAGRVEEGFARSAPGMREQPGFVQFRLLRGQVEGQAFYIAETTWQDEASYQAWAQSDAFARAHGGPGSGGGPLQSEVERFEVATSVEHA